MSVTGGDTIVVRVTFTDADGDPVTVSSPVFQVYNASYEQIYSSSSVTDEGSGVYSAKYAVPAISSPSTEPVSYVFSMSGTINGDSIVSRKRVSSLFVGDCR